jgi:hypothetical protein
MSSIDVVVSHVVPGLYRRIRSEKGLGKNFDVTGLTEDCPEISLYLSRLLLSWTHPARREMHTLPESGLTYFVVSHAKAGLEASNTDVITDLIPWNFENSSHHTGYLHGPRQDVMEILAGAGAPEEHVALRGLETLVLTHVMDL